MEMLYIPGVGERYSVIYGEANAPGAAYFYHLEGPSQLGRACGALLDSEFALELGPRLQTSYYARTSGGSA
jgi:hypothetical protein